MGLTGLFAIACAPTYGEAEPAPGPATASETRGDKLPNEPEKPKAKPPTTHGGGSNVTSGNGDAGAPPKVPGDGGVDAAGLDGGACSRPPAAGGYTINTARPQAIGACSTADIGYYEGLLAVEDQTFGGLEKALKDRSALCASCVFSKYEDETWAPVVMLSADSGFYNWGSCYANAPGGSPECGAQVQQWFSCLDDACGDCVSDAEYDACIDKASADPAQCGALKFDACGANLQALNVACDSIAKSITVACGP